MPTRLGEPHGRASCVPHDTKEQHVAPWCGHVLLHASRRLGDRVPPRRACRWSVGLRRTRRPPLDDVHDSLHGVPAHNHKQAHRGFLAGGRTHEEHTKNGRQRSKYVLNFREILVVILGTRISLFFLVFLVEKLAQKSQGCCEQLTCQRRAPGGSFVALAGLHMSSLSDCLGRTVSCCHSSPYGTSRENTQDP